MRGLALVILAAAACSPYAPNLPSEPFLCGDTDPVCPDGFTCTANVCVQTAGGSDGVDAGSGGGSCAKTDSMLEPNDTPQTAYPTPVASQRNSLDLTQLAICPASDVDYYKFTITVENQSVDASVTFDSGAPLQLAILLDNGGSGTVVKNGATVPGMTNVVDAKAAKLTTGTYFAEVFGASGTNTYALDLTVSGP